jgi:hypothetical protein
VLDADAYESDPELKQIRKERGYDYEVCPPLHVWTFYVCGLDSLEVFNSLARIILFPSIL